MYCTLYRVVSKVKQVVNCSLIFEFSRKDPPCQDGDQLERWYGSEFYINHLTFSTERAGERPKGGVPACLMVPPAGLCLEALGAARL